MTLAVNAEKVAEVNRLIEMLRRARGHENKAKAAANLLAELDQIPNTPAGKHCWVEDL